METALTRRLGIVHPIWQAPMGGGPSTPALAAAVSNAGGLGSLAGGYLSPDQLRREVAATRALTDRPFAVNLFAGGHDARAHRTGARMLALLAPLHAALQLPAPALPPLPPDRFEAQVAAVLESPPAVVSFTFGIPPRAVVERLQRLGVCVVGTATAPVEGRLWQEAGADVVVAQGAEAGAHRGTFAVDFEAGMFPTDELVRALAAERAVPVVASGGLMDGADLARVLRLGAGAAQLGTAFLACPESGAPDAYKRALVEAEGDRTVVTRAFTGRPARGLRNAFTDLLAGEPDAVLPYPLQHALTRPLRDAAARLARAEYLSLWAGQGVARMRALPAAALVRALVAECDVAWTEEA